MAAYKGKLYCKAHLKEMFLLRGSYDDIKPEEQMKKEKEEKAAGDALIGASFARSSTSIGNHYYEALVGKPLRGGIRKK